MSKSDILERNAFRVTQARLANSKTIKAYALVAGSFFVRKEVENSALRSIVIVHIDILRYTIALLGWRSEP